jgi:3-dehydrosphinganine reductase
MARYVATLPLVCSASSDNQAKTVLLLGASEGMGKSVAKQLAQKGANLIIVARNVGRLEEALAQIKVDTSSFHHATSN